MIEQTQSPDDRDGFLKFPNLFFTEQSKCDTIIVNKRIFFSKTRRKYLNQMDNWISKRSPKSSPYFPNQVSYESHRYRSSNLCKAHHHLSPEAQNTCIYNTQHNTSLVNTTVIHTSHRHPPRHTTDHYTPGHSPRPTTDHYTPGSHLGSLPSAAFWVLLLTALLPATALAEGKATSWINNYNILNLYYYLKKNIIKKNVLKAGREQSTPYQSEVTSSTIPTHRMKKEKGKTVG